MVASRIGVSRGSNGTRVKVPKQENVHGPSIGPELSIRELAVDRE